jgi:hypothetical protein
VLIASIAAQSEAEAALHLLLWDDRRDAKAKSPATYNGPNRLSLVLPRGPGRNGNAPGSPLRAVGLMAAASEWVTFAKRRRPLRAGSPLGAPRRGEGKELDLDAPHRLVAFRRASGRRPLPIGDGEPTVTQGWRPCRTGPRPTKE